MQTKILLADDHSMIRKGVKLLCELQLGFTDVQAVPSCSELMKELAKKKYTHLVLDINLSDGSSLEVLPNIRSLYPDLQISILSMQPAAIYARTLKQQYGISLFISKAAPEEDTIQRLRQFFQNEQPARDPAGMGQSNSPFSDFTPRELEILHYMLKGIGTNEIAKALNLKWNTISTVKNRIFEKTTTTNLIELKELATLCKVN
jgi:two-component system, NarL family, invasion response regulator UvrY